MGMGGGTGGPYVSKFMLAGCKDVGVSEINETFPNYLLEKAGGRDAYILTEWGKDVVKIDNEEVVFGRISMVSPSRGILGDSKLDHLVYSVIKEKLIK